MCEGTTTRLICGHELVHITSLCPDDCRKVTSEPSFLDDTCADCHPPYRVKCLNEVYQKRRDELAEKMRAALEARHGAAAQVISKEIDDSLREHMTALREAKKYPFREGEVLFPGKEALD